MAWIVAVVFLTGVASRQVHPGWAESAIAALVLSVAAAVSIAAAPVAALQRWLLVIVGAALGAVVIGYWNPWNLAAVQLILLHPFVAVAAVCGVLARVLKARERPGPIRVATAGTVALVAAVGAMSVIAGAGALVFFAPGDHMAHSSETAGDVRIDRHDAGENGRCAASILRTGSGLLMRERVLRSGCVASAELVNEHLVAEHCGGLARNMRITAFDPDTLAFLAQTDVGECRS